MKNKREKRKRNNNSGRPTPRATRRSENQSVKRSIAKKAVSEKDGVRFVALGGLEEVGRNMMFLEYGEEIIIIDAGLQFPEEETPGIDYIIPNTSYLEAKKENIKGLVITHGHYDHIGAIPHIMDRIGNPTIYATRLTKEVLAKRQTDFPKAPQLNIEVINPDDKVRFSKNFGAEFFPVEHNIPEGIGMIINTPVGKIVHPGEFKLDRDINGEARGLDIWERVGKQGIHTLLLDSTASERKGESMSEEVVAQELEKLFKAAKGRIIVSTFASLLDRLSEIIKVSEKMGRVIAISGYSMKTNLEIARELGYIKPKKGTMISLDEIKNYPDNKVMILSTGAQGEEKASLMRISNGEHKQIQIKSTDTVILSSSVVPGNERGVQNIKDNLARQGARVYDSKMLDIHSSGHAPQEDLKTVMKLVKPKFFLPIHGYYFMRWKNGELAKETLGLKDENIILADNGLVVNINKDSAKVTDEQLPASYVLVDGLGVGGIGEVVLRDRRALSEEGMIVVIATISKKGGKVLKNPDIISRGFIYLKENRELLNDIRRKIRSIIEKMPNKQSIDVDYAKTLIRDQVSKYVYRKTRKRPMVLPVIIEV